MTEPTQPTEPANLPAIITNQGGALVSVLSWDQHLVALTKPQQLKVGMIVKRYPDLNTEPAVDMLADAAGHYGERLDKWFEGVVEEHGIEAVYMAIELLHMLGMRGSNEEVRPEKTARFHNDERFDLDEMLGLIQTLGELDRTFGDVEDLHRCIDRLGGWAMARLLDRDQIEGLLTGDLDVNELREEVGAPNESDLPVMGEGEMPEDDED